MNFFPNAQLDSLQNPCADLGMEVPSMLHYKYHPEKEVSAYKSLLQTSIVCDSVLWNLLPEHVSLPQRMSSIVDS